MSEVGASSQTICFHCGQPSADGSFMSGERAFCCAGCRAVYEILSSANLGAYYTAGETVGSKPTGHTPERFAYLDDPSILSRFLDFSSEDHCRVKLAVPQIHCSACIWLLENIFRLHQGIKRSVVDFVARHVTVEYDPREITLSGLVALLAKLGYEPDIRLDGLEPVTHHNPNLSLYIRIGVAAFSFANIMLFSFPEYLSSGKVTEVFLTAIFRYANLILAVPVFVYSAADYYRSAWAGLRQRTINLDFPISLGLVALFGRSVWDIVSGAGPGYFDSFAGLVFFLLLGKLFQRKTYQWLSFDRDYRAYFPIAVRRRNRDGEESTAVTNIQVGDRLVIRHQELIPADSIVINGKPSIDYSFVTGESDPHDLKPGDRVYAGGRQLAGAIVIEVIKTIDQSYLISLWSRRGDEHSAPRLLLSRVTDGVGKYFTAAVLAIASGTAIWWMQHDSAKWVAAFTSVLIVACPCAIALSTPFTFGTAMRIFGRNKLFLRHPDVVDTLSRIDTVVFDKTGTLTLANEKSVRFSGTVLTSELRRLIASATAQSTHPASRQIFKYLGADNLAVVDSYHEEPGQGFSAKVLGAEIRLGKRNWVSGSEIPATAKEADSVTLVHASINGEYLGAFELGSIYRKGIETELRTLGRERELSVLSGDTDRDEQYLRSVFGGKALLSFHQSPHDKRDHVDRLGREGRRVLMFGDGLNDAGALRSAAVGIAVTEDTSAFTPACDGILHGSQLPRVSRFLAAARRARTVVYLSFGISIIYNILGLSLAATGHLSPLASAILMPVSSVSVILFATGATWLAARREGLV